MDIPIDTTLLMALLISCLILYLSLNKIWRYRNLPPGPTPLPLLGNALQIGRGNLLNALKKFSEKYGEVFTIYLGSRPVVVVTGYKCVKEILVDRGDDFLNRGDIPAWDAYYKNHGFAFTSVMEWWREIRRFSVSALRNFGKRSTEELILEEAQYLVAEFKKNKESFFDPKLYISKAACNIIHSIMFGHRKEYDDEEILKILSIIYEGFTSACSSWGQLYEMFPTLMRFIPGPHHKTAHSISKLIEYTEKRVKLNLKTLDPLNPRDYLDAFLIKAEKEKMNPSNAFSMRNLLTSTVQMFYAGIETTGTTLYYSLLLLMKYPDVLAKVYNETDNVTDRNRSPTLQDRNSMPYTEAVIHEIQRFTDLAPMGGPRRTTREVKLNGYTIPKDTNVFLMLTSVLKDPTCFKYPTEFNPENFLNEKGEFQKNEAFVPMSAGKRNCIGEPLARMELFLFLTTILQNFNLKSPVPVEELDIIPLVSGIGNFPRPYKVAFIARS